jgi:hypothetical protein
LVNIGIILKWVFNKLSRRMLNKLYCFKISTSNEVIWTQAIYLVVPKIMRISSVTEL